MIELCLQHINVYYCYLKDRLSDSLESFPADEIKDDDYSLELDIPSQFQLSPRDHNPSKSQSQQPQLRRQHMTPQLAQQKASDLSYEIGALKKIQERLERQRERLLMYCMNGGNSID
jgi:hypothetical protein